MCLLFETSLPTGVLPSDWPKARVSPLFKKEDKSDLANYLGRYRPPVYFARLWSISLRPTLPRTSASINFCISCSMVSVRSTHAKHSSYSLLRTSPDNLFKVSRLAVSYWTLAKLLTRSTTSDCFLNFPNMALGVTH